MPDERYRRNLAALRRVLPELTINAVEDAGRTPLQIVAESAIKDINLDLGHAELYAGGAANYASGQVAQYIAQPNRLSFDPPRFGTNWIKGEGSFYRSVIDQAGALPDPAPDKTDITVGALVSFGVGLGLHLPLLRQRLEFLDLILVEPYPHFVEASLRILDWDELIADIYKSDGTLSVFIGDDAPALASQAFEAMRGNGFARLDGSFVFTHYNSPTLNKARDLFAEQVPALGSSLGFVEDECIMVRNALANFDKPGGNIAPSAYRTDPACPTLVIGSGPSLDHDMDEIRRLREDAILISGGTALGALLENGIFPDLHCEVENPEGIYDGLAMVAERHDLSSIPLLCTVTVDPRIPDLFGKTLFYFQDRVTSTVLFEGNFGCWRHATPSVTNLALRAGVWLGSKEVYFFGLDLGSTTPDKHHSSSSYYAWTDDEYWTSGARMEPFTIPQEGNFQDTIYTNIAFLFTKAFFNAFSVMHPDINLFNCSDGVRIENAAPSPASQVRLPKSDRSGAEIVSAAIDDCPEKSTVTGNTTDILNAYDNALKRWINAADKILQSAVSIDQAISDLRPLLDQTTPGSDADVAARGCYSGTMHLLLQYAFAHHRRLQAAERSAFDETALQAIRTHLEEMQALTTETLSGHAKGISVP